MLARPGVPDTLDILVATRRPSLCVVLSACYSQPQAAAIAEHIDAVIGMSAAIPDDDARTFAGAFYEALAEGEHVKRAFELGCSAIAIARSERRGPARDVVVAEPSRSPDAMQVPQLHVRPGFDASDLRFVTRTPR